MSAGVRAVLWENGRDPSDDDPVTLQEALLGCEIVTERRFADYTRPSYWHSLKLNNKLILLGDDIYFAEMLQYAMRRNAEAFEHQASSPAEGKTP